MKVCMKKLVLNLSVIVCATFYGQAISSEWNIDIRTVFLDDQENNVQELLENYKKREESLYSILCSQAKEKLQKKYEEELQVYKAQGWRRYIWNSGLKAPIKPTDVIAEAEVQREIQEAQKTDFVKTNRDSEYDLHLPTLLILRADMHYYETQYLQDKQLLATLTEQQIKNIFEHRYKLLRARKTQTGSQMLEWETLGWPHSVTYARAEFMAVENYIHNLVWPDLEYLLEYVLVPSKEDPNVSPFDRPIAIVFKACAQRDEIIDFAQWKESLKRRSIISE